MVFLSRETSFPANSCHRSLLPYVARQRRAQPTLSSDSEKLAHTTDEQRVPLRPVETNDVDYRLRSRRVNHLADAQQWGTRTKIQKLRYPALGHGRVYFLIGISQFNVAVMFQRGEQ